MKRILLILAAFALAATAFAQMPQELPNDPETRVGKLDNGLTYYIRHNDKPAQRAEFYLATNVGAIQETPEQDGLAHFLEHMCFNGTENFPEKTLLEYLQSIGVEFGRNINASTGIEQTEYMLNNIPVIREGIVDTCLLIMHDYSHYVTCDPIEIDKERGVIVEEKRTRNTASWRMYLAQRPYLYGQSKYADCSLIGSEENLYNFKPETLVDFYHTWYRPDLQALVVVGDIDVDAVEAKVQALFSTIPMPENPQPKEYFDVEGCETPRIGIITDPENTGTAVTVYWLDDPIPREMRNTNMAYLQNLLKAFISRIMNERFGDIAAKPDAPFLYGRLGMGSLTQTADAIMASAGVKDADATMDGFRTLMTEIRKMQLYGFTEDEFNRAKDEILSQLEKEVEAADSRKNAEFIEPILDNFFNNEPFMEPEFEYEMAQQFCAMLSAQMLNQVVGQLISDENMVIIYEGIDKEGLTHPTEADFLAAVAQVAEAEIEANEAESFDEPLLDPEALAGSAISSEEEGLYGSTIWTLGNGVKVVALPTEYKKDQVIIRINKEGGRSLIATEDLPSFESNVMSTFERNSGLSKFPKTTLDKMLAGVRVNLSFNLGAINHTLSATCPPKDLEKAFQLLYLKYVDPRFDPDEWSVGMNMLASILPNYVTTPDYSLMKEVYNSRYGENPRNILVSEELLGQASMETFAKVYKEQLFPNAAGDVVYIVGNADLETLKPLVEKYLGSLPAGTEAPKWNAENVLKTQEGKVVDDFSVAMEAPKSTVYQIKTIDTPYSIKDEVAYDAVEYIMQMIYTDTLREDEGGTYGAGVNCSLTREPFEQVTFLVAFDTKPESADKLREIAVKNFEDFASEGPSEEYFARTIENFKKNIPESRISNSYWMSNLSRYVKYGEDYDAAYETAVNELTPADVQAAARHILSTENWIEIVMRPDATDAGEIKTTEAMTVEAATEETVTAE